MDLKIKDKVAIVLAASKGLGRAIATELSQEGALVVIASRNKAELDRTASELSAETEGKVIAIQADVNYPEQLSHLINETIRIFGRIDILVNNAGGPPFGQFEKLDDGQWQKAFDQNLLSFVRTCRLVIPYMRKSGSGRIINIISTSVKAVLTNSVLSTSMRMGVVGMAKMLADEVGPDHITINNVAPGLILTDRIKETMTHTGVDYESALKQRAELIPARRIGKPKELAALVAFLASEQAAYISGTTIQVDGGASRSIF
jgi:3-oxoacyl-[acyl-carrier protein] reductase